MAMFSITIASLADFFVLNQSVRDWQDEDIVNFLLRAATLFWKDKDAQSTPW